MRAECWKAKTLEWRAGVVIGFIVVISALASFPLSSTASTIIAPELDSLDDGTGLDTVRPVWINATCTNLSDYQTIEIDGVNETTPIIKYWDDGSIHILRVYVDSHPIGCTYCKFNSWEDGSTSLERTIMVSGPMNILAWFDDFYEVGVTTNYQQTESLWVYFAFWGDDIIIYAEPDLIVGYVRRGNHGADAPTPQVGKLSFKNYYFQYWIIDDGVLPYNTTENPITFDLITCTWLVAYFVPGNPITVEIATNVGALLVGYDSNPLSPAPISFQSEQGKMHTLLTSSPQERQGTRYVFVDWLGGPATLDWTVTLPSEEAWQYVANFVPSMRYVSIIERTSCGGQMSLASGWYPEGAILNITWTPPGSPPLGAEDVFFRWRGTGNGSYTGRQFTATVTVNGPIEEVAECLCIRSNNTDIIARGEGIEVNRFSSMPGALEGSSILLDRVLKAASCELLCPPRPCR